MLIKQILDSLAAPSINKPINSKGAPHKTNLCLTFRVTFALIYDQTFLWASTMRPQHNLSIYYLFVISFSLNFKILHICRKLLASV
ncbi:hypothetical protein M5D96_005953, partial [Drosophila gunungcola]